MANNVKYSFQISADAAQAQKTLDELNQSLNKLQKMAYIDMSFDKDILQAADAAKVLQRELTAATNIKTGKLDMVEFASGLRAAGTSVDDLSQKLLQAGKIGQQAFQGMVSTLSAADVPIKKMNATLSNALTTLKNTIKWEASSTIVHGLEGAFSSAVSYAKNLNTSLTNIRIVTGQTIDDMAKFTVSANKAAKELSTTTKAYADAALIYYQQGDSSEEVAKKTAITIKAANAAANTSAAEMSEYLTAVWNSYQVGADELERYVDIMAALGAKTATSLEEIATSMQKVAATGNTVGVSMEQVSSIIATVSSVTRESAESIGTSYKTIFARMGDLKLGETDEDGVGLGQVSSALESIGVQVLDAQGQLRDMGDIVTDLGDKWQTMNGAQKTAIAQVVAGKRQYTQLMALFENWDMYKDNMAIAGDAEGSLQNMADIYAESWEGASARVKAATEGIYGQLINDQSMIKMTNSFANMLGGIEGVIKGMGGLGGVLTHFGAIASTVFKSKIAQSVDTTVEKLVNFKNSFQGKKGLGEILKSAFGETTGLRQYKAELKELQGQLGTITAGGSDKEQDVFKAGVLQDIISSKEKLLELESKMTPLEKQRAQTSIDSLNKELSNVDNLSTEWEDYNKSLQKSMNSITSITEQYKAFKNVSKEDANADNIKSKMQKRIHSMFNLKSVSVSAMFNNQTLFGKDVGKDSSLDKLIKRYKDLNVISSAASGAVGDLDNISKSIKGLNIAASKNSTELQPVLDVLNNLKTVLNKNNLPTTWLDELIYNIKTSDDTTENVLKQLKQELDSVWESTSRMSGKAAVTLEKSLGISSDKLLEIAQKAGLSSEALAKLAQAMKNVENNAEKLNDNLNTKGKKSFGEYFADFTSGAMNAMSSFNSFSSLVKNFDSGDVSDKIGSIADSLLEIGTAVASGDVVAVIGSIIGTITGAITGAIDKHNESVQRSIENTKKILDESHGKIEESTKVIDEAYKIYEETQKAYDAGEVSQETLLSSVDSVLAALDLEELKVLALTGSYDNLTQAIKNARNASTEESITEAENLYTSNYFNLDKSLRAYKGSGSATIWGGSGRNTVNLGTSYREKGINQTDVESIMTDVLGFTLFNRGSHNVIASWEGKQEDVDTLQSGWDALLHDQKYAQFRTTESFAILNEYMAQFDSIFTNNDLLMNLQASDALQDIDAKQLQSETLYEDLISIILNSFGTTEAEATPYQLEMAQQFASNYVKNLDTSMQAAFASQSGEANGQKAAQDYAKKYSIKVSDSAVLSPEFLTLDQATGEFVDGIDQDTWNKIEKYQLYSQLMRSASRSTDNLSSIITTAGIQEAEYANVLGINLNGHTLDSYMADASEATKNNIRDALVQWLIDQGSILEKEFSIDNIMQTKDTIIADKKLEISKIATDFIAGLYDDASFFQETDLTNKDQYLKLQEHWLALEREENGEVLYTDFNKDYIKTLGQSDQLLANQLDTLIGWDGTRENAIDIDAIFGTDSYLSSLYGDIEALDVWANGISTELSTLIKDEGFKKSIQDFGQLKDLAADLQWSENEQAMFGKMAYGYGVDISEWQYKDQAVRSEEAYNVMRGAFDQKYAGKVPSKETDVNGYQNYLEDVKALSAFTEERFAANVEQLNSELDNNISLLDSFANTDLTQPLQKETEVAKLLQTTLNLSVEDFNKLAPSAKNIQLLKAEQKLRENYRDSLQTEYDTWLATDEVKALNAEKDAKTLEAQREKEVQVAQAQADVATTAKEISSSYKELNDTKIGQIADKWEQANESAEKLSTKAEVLSDAFESGELSAQDETILALNTEANAVKITAEAWAGYSAQKKAEIAAQAQYSATKATTDQLTTEQKAITAAQTQLTTWFDNTAKTFSEQDLSSKIIDPEKFEEYLSGLQIPDDGLKPLREAYDKAIEKLGKEAKAEDIIIEMQAILKDKDVDLTALINQANAAGQDAISGILNGLSAEIQSKAQEAVDAWISAFETIADARDALIKGEDEDLWSQLAGNPDKLQQLFKQYKQIYQNASLESFISGIIGGTITESDLPQIDVTSDDYLQNRYKEEGFVYDLSNNRVADIQDTEARIKQINPQADAELLASETRKYYTDLFKAATDLTDEVIAEKVTDILGSDAEKGNAAYQELMSAVDERKLAIAGTEQFRALTLERQETLNATEFAGNVENLTINAQGQIKTIDENGKEVWQDTGLTRQDGQIASYEEWTRLQGAIDRAQEAKYAGESWESLSEEDRQLLGQYGIDFSNVDTAAASCASALSACAAAASALAQAAAGAGGYTEVNGEWGKQTTYTDEQGKAVYGDQWENIKENWTANEDGSYTSGWNKDNEMTNLMNQSNQVIESAKATEVDTQAQTFERMASSVDMTVEQLSAYKDKLIESGEMAKMSTKEQMDYTRSLARTEKGMKKAKDSLNGYIKSLNKAKTINGEYTNTLESVRDIYADVFDLSEKESKQLSESFLKSEKNAKLLQEAIKGSDQAWDALKSNVAKDIFANVAKTADKDLVPQLNQLADQIAAYDFGDLEIGASLDTTDFYSALDGMIIGSQAAADAISAGLSSMGVEATIKEHTENVPPTTTEVVVQNGSYTWPDGKGGLKTIPLSATIVETDGGQQYKWYTIEGANYGGKGVTRGGGGSSGGGGGGGGKKPQKKEHKRPKDEIERYHRNNSAITQVENELKKLTAVKDSAYGKNYVDAIDAETAALRREREEQEKLRQEAANYVRTDAADLIAAGAQIGESGVIENYDALMQRWINEYNDAVDAWNNSEQEENDQEDFDKANQLYEDRLQLIQDYEEALDVAAEAEARLQEILNEISENTLEGITYTLELELEVNERDLELLEYYREQYEETLQDQDNLFANLIQQAGEYETNFASLQAAYNDLMAEYNNGNGNLQEDEYAEGLADLHSQILENLQNLQDVKDEIAEVYSNALDLATEEVEDATEALDHMNETMEAYIAIMGLSGRETDYATMQAFYDAQFATNMANIEVQTKMLAGLREQEEYFKNRKEQNGELTDLEQEQYDALMKKIRETESAVLDSTQTTLEVLQAGYENTINRIAQDLDEFMAGAAGSISHLQEQYAYFREEQGRYVSTAKELYEVSSLNRDIENTLAETTSAASKEALKALQEKINKQSELNEMTEYDIEMNQLQYQLLLARIQLEEAQNSKDTVRLTRDDNGNYAYQYTADEDKVSEAMQKYEDTLQKMNDVTVQRTSEIEQQMINSMAEYKEKMQEIAMDTTLSESEKYNRLLELQSQFDAEMAYLQEQAGIANENLLTNQEAIADHYGVNITEITSSTAGNVNQTVQDMIANAQEYSQAMHDALFGPDGVSQSWSDYLAAVTTVQQASGTTVDDMLNNTANVGEVNEDAVQTALDAIEALTGTLEPINQMTEAWDAHQEALQGTIDSYEDLLVHINDLMAALGQTNTDPNLNPEGTNTNASTRAATTFDRDQEEKVADETNVHTGDLMPNEEIASEHLKPDKSSGGGGGRGKKTPRYGREYFEEVTEDSLAAAADYTDDLANKIDEISDHYVEAFIKVAEDEELTESEKYKQILELQNIFDEEMEMLRESHKKQQLEYANLIDESEKMYDLWLNQINTLTQFSMLNSYHAQGLINEVPVVIDQNVTIEAEFPNVSSTDEIIEAFNELINRAAQFASAKK